MPEGPWHASVPVLAAAAAVTDTRADRHARRHAEFPPPGHARPRGPGARRRERRPPRPRAGPGQRRAPTPPCSGRTRGRRRNGSRASSGSSHVLQPIVDGEPDARTSRQTSHYSAERSAQHAGRVQRPLPLSIAAGGAKGMRLVALYGRNWVTIGPTGRALARPDGARRGQGSSRSSTRPAASVDRAPSSVGKILLWTPPEPVIDLARPVRRARGALRRSGLRPVRAPPSGPDGALRRRRRRLREDRRPARSGLTDRRKARAVPTGSETSPCPAPGRQHPTRHLQSGCRGAYQASGGAGEWARAACPRPNWAPSSRSRERPMAARTSGNNSCSSSRTW